MLSWFSPQAPHLTALRGSVGWIGAVTKTPPTLRVRQSASEKTPDIMLAHQFKPQV